MSEQTNTILEITADSSEESSDGLMVRCLHTQTKARNAQIDVVDQAEYLCPLGY